MSDLKVKEIYCLTCGKSVAFDKRIHYAYCSEECANIRKRELIKKAYPPVMSIDKCIAYLENVAAEKKPRSRKARRIIEHLKELKRYKETAAGYGARTERDSFYYGQGYKDGRKELVDELMGKLSEEVDGDSND